LAVLLDFDSPFSFPSTNFFSMFTNQPDNIFDKRKLITFCWFC
jgi:hypothetical protein